MNPFKLTSDEVLKLKDQLPYGAMTRIATDLGITRSYVSGVLNNTLPYNKHVVKAVLDYLEKSKNESLEIRERFENLSSKTI